MYQSLETALVRDDATVRGIRHRTRGSTRGGITRLVSPGDLGELIKPFAFLDWFDLEPHSPTMRMHPHSGIATVTVIVDGVVEYRETTGHEGILRQGGVEWMSAGGGVWHGGGVLEGVGARGFQLWLALPPEDEHAPPSSLYLTEDSVERVGPARVVIGRYGDAVSAIRPRASINYLHVALGDGERWRYRPPAGHVIAWLAVATGSLDVGGTCLTRELAVFEDGDGAIDVVARGATQFVLGSAIRHPYPLITGHYSVHTSDAALRRGEAEIKRLEYGLRLAGDV